MTDFFKTVRAYLRGKWERKREIMNDGYRAALVLDANGRICGYRSSPSPSRDLMSIVSSDVEIHTLRNRIDSLRRAKKKHSHLQKQLDDLLNGGAQTNDQQMETTK